MSVDPLSIAAERIVVIAPHPDDEALGCGGLIASLAAAGRAFLVVFVTDGGASHRGSRTWSRQRLAAQRRQEAGDALVCLGLAREAALFLDLPDATMPPLAGAAGRAVLERLAPVLTAFDPDLVILPWRRDPHCDHRDAWALTMKALEMASLRPEILEYAVWLDELGAAGDHPAADEAVAVVFDISPALDAKRAAVAAHLSQTTDLIADDPGAFRLTESTIDRLVGPTETYWRPLG